MALTAAQRQANRRARLKGIPEPYNLAEIKKQQEAQVDRESQAQKLLAEVAALDQEGKRFKSEVRNYTRLVRLYYGQAEVGDVDEEASGSETSKKSKGPKSPNPSETRIRIQDSSVDPVKRSRKGSRSVENTAYEVDDIVSFWRWLNLRDRARKDLFWLGRLLGKGLYRSVHQITCDQFVPKNFGGPWLNQDGTEDKIRPRVEPMYFENYTLDDFHDMIEAQHEFREREMMLLDSRGFYKSTIDGIDAVQWLLNCPDIRIFLLTGEFKLAVSFMKEIKDYFFLADGAEPTAFHLLFPEYILRGVDGTSKEPLECPARIHPQKEASLWVNAIVANLSGWHCDIKKGDDIVTDENSNTEDAREKLKVKYDGTGDLLDPHGFEDHIGTRYFTDDWYGTRLAPNPETGEVAPIKYHKRGCWIVKPEYAEVSLLKLTEEMVLLTFPQKWNFKRLRNELLKKGERYFKNQQLNEPTDAQQDSGFKISFTEADLRTHMYQREAAPKTGDVFIVWDWALSDKKTSDYSVGVVARLYKNDMGEWSFAILEIVYDKWKHSELAYQIIALSKRYGPKVTMIEQSNGADLLKDEIIRVGHRLGYQPYIYWKQPSREENAKRNRIKSVEILLNEHRLYFVLGPWIDETIKQFVQYTGEKKNKGRKDDIPDGVSYLVYLLPAEARPRSEKTDPDEERRIEEERIRQYHKQEQYNRIFGDFLSTRTEAGPTIVEEVPKKMDPRMIVFGNKGPWRL
jgi:predicted phage terminase large subunit-like protein